MRAPTLSIAYETAGAACTRHSLRPRVFEGARFPAKLGRIGAAGMRSHIRHSGAMRKHRTRNLEIPGSRGVCH
ncbi:MAG: hypothetical protein WA812_10900, partial [Candidatus Cybelea sp.]